MHNIEIDERPNEIFIPVPNNPLHQNPNQIHKIGARDLMEQEMNTLNKITSVAPPLSLIKDMLLLSSPISGASSTHSNPSQEIMVVPPVFQQVKYPSGKSNLKVNVGNNTKLMKPVMAGVIKHVTHKTPEVEGALLPAHTQIIAGDLPSPQIPFTLANFSAEEYCFSDDISVKERGTRDTTTKPPVYKSERATIVAFTPRQRAPIHGTRFTRINLMPSLGASSAQENVQGIASNSYVMLNDTPTRNEQAAIPPRIGRKLGPFTHEIAHQIPQSVTRSIGPDLIKHRASDPPITYHGTKSLDNSPSAPKHGLTTSRDVEDFHHIPPPIPAGSFTIIPGVPFIPSVTHRHSETPLLVKEHVSTPLPSQDNKQGSVPQRFEAQSADSPRAPSIITFDRAIGQTALVGVANLPQRNPIAPSRSNETSAKVPVSCTALTLSPHPPSPTHHVNSTENAVVSDESRLKDRTSKKERETEQKGPYVDKGIQALPPQPPVIATAKHKVSSGGSGKAIQFQVGRRSEPCPQKGEEKVRKRKRDGEAAASLQPVLKTPRKETPAKRQMTMLLTGTSHGAILDVSLPDQHVHPLTAGAFTPRSRRLSLDSANTEPPRDPRRIKFLTLPIVIGWKTDLDRIAYLHQLGKIGQAEANNLEEVLMVIKANMDHPVLTADWIKRAGVVMGLKSFRRRGNGVFTVASKRAAREILRFWEESPKFGMA